MSAFDEQYRLDVAEAIKRTEAAEAEARRRQALLDAAPRMLAALETVVEVFYRAECADAVMFRNGPNEINLSALIREARGENV